MHIHNRNRNWLKEVSNALQKAEKKSVTNDEDPIYLYRHALPQVIRNRRITNKEVIAEMTDQIEKRVKQDWDIEYESRYEIRFHFVSSYIFSHVAAGFFDEFVADKLMRYLVDNMYIFEEK